MAPWRPSPGPPALAAVTGDPAGRGPAITPGLQVTGAGAGRPGGGTLMTTNHYLTTADKRPCSWPATSVPLVTRSPRRESGFTKARLVGRYTRQ